MNKKIINTWGEQRIFERAIDGFAFIFPAALLLVNRSDSVSLVVLSLSGLIAYIFSREKLKFSNFEKFIFLVFFLTLMVMIACYLLGDRTEIGFRMVGRNLRLILFIPIYILFRLFTPRGQAFFAGTTLAAVAIAIAAYHAGQAEHFTTRVFDITDAITFGDISLVIGFWSLSLVMATSDRRRRKYLYWFSAVGFLSGLIGSFLSGSRGGWIAIPPLAIIAVFAFIKNTNAVFWRALIGILSVILIAIIFVPKNILIDRIDLAVNETAAFLSQHKTTNEESSITGCVNNEEILLGLVQAMKADGYLQMISAEVVNDSTSLARDGWLKRCKSSYVIQVTNLSTAHAAALAIPRSVVNSTDWQAISVLVKGSGELNLNGGMHDVVNFNTSEYKVINLVDKVANGQAPFPVLILPPSGKLTLLPLTLQPGEYTWYYALQSIGKRLEMWRAAWVIFLNHPLLGAGTGSYEHLASEYVRDNSVAPSIANYDHPHNDYLNVLYSEGIVGLVSFFLLIGSPCYLYIKSLRSPDSVIRAAAFCGLVMNVGLLIFGLTESMFVHSLVLSWYVIVSAMLCAMIYSKTQEFGDRNI